jgi:hypothetical protein
MSSKFAQKHPKLAAQVAALRKNHPTKMIGGDSSAKGKRATGKIDTSLRNNAPNPNRKKTATATSAV